MSIGIDTFDREDLFFDCANWALENGIWDGRPVSWLDVEKTQNEIIHRIHQLLFSFDPGSRAFEEMALQFARLGSTGATRSLIEKEIDELRASPSGDVFLAKRGFWSKLWKHHKTEIILGIVVVGIISGVAIAAVCLGGGAAGAAASAGASLIEDMSNKNPDEPKISLQTAPPVEHPRPNINSEIPATDSHSRFSQDEFSFLENGVIAEGQFYTHLRF